MLNAIRYSNAKSPITLSVEAKDSILSFSVADRGKGLAEKDLPHIFEKFYRTTRSQTGGLGLGLSIVKGFVEVHGGTVSAENRPDGGALFSMRLPIEATAPDIPESASVE